jgi:excisionase family DNA binding protein
MNPNFLDAVRTADLSALPEIIGALHRAEAEALIRIRTCGPTFDPGGTTRPEAELTPEDVAATTKLSRCTVYGLLRTGRLRGRRSGRLWRVLPSDLADYQTAPIRGVAGSGSKARGPRQLKAII